MSDDGHPAIPAGSAQDRAEWLRLTVEAFVLSLQHQEGYGVDEIAAELVRAEMIIRRGRT